MVNGIPGRGTTPAAVLTYGLLGLLPFVGPPVLGLMVPAAKGVAGLVLAVYGGLILSFLGGARWGAEIRSPVPNAATISFAMIPTLAALALLVAVPGHLTVRLVGLAAALIVHWIWDLRGDALPTWYPGLRTLLTAGAVVGLLFGAAVLP